MPSVKTVQDKGDKAALLILDDGSKPIWTPDRELARTLLGKPIPPDWVRKDGEYGPQAFPPKTKGQGRYRDTKEAFEAEAASRLAWQQVEEERKDRRTALMTAAEHMKGSLDVLSTIHNADVFYEWLRSSPAVSEPSSQVGVATKPDSAQCGPHSGAGDPSSVSGMGKAGAEEPDTGGGQGMSSPTAAPPGFPVDPSACDHKGPSGRWLPTKVIDGKAVCPRCGLPALIYRETA